MPRIDKPIDSPNDPYATPHAPKERSGPVLRVAIIAILLVGAGLAWNSFSNSNDSQGLTPSADNSAIEQPIQVADSGAAGETVTDNGNAAPAQATPRANPAPTRTPSAAPS